MLEPDPVKFVRRHMLHVSSPEPVPAGTRTAFDVGAQVSFTIDSVVVDARCARFFFDVFVGPVHASLTPDLLPARMFTAPFPPSRNTPSAWAVPLRCALGQKLHVVCENRGKVARMFQAVAFVHDE
jgi:hypothetical protein